MIRSISTLVCNGKYIISLLFVLTWLYVHRTGFKPKKIKINLNQPIKAEVKAESTDVMKTVDEDRKYAIQATIVRYAPSFRRTVFLFLTTYNFTKYTHTSIAPSIRTHVYRIMKARKTMKNQSLIQEVISQITQRFTPRIPDIKKAIDTLLEKEYIERVDGTRDTFAYVA